MLPAVQIFAVLAALLHVFFFYLESIAFKKNGTYKAFGVADERDAEVVAPMALNQGFYNLFLAIGVLIGVAFSTIYVESGWTAYAPLSDDEPLSMPLRFQLQAWAAPLVVFGLACMLGAAIVLLISSKGKLLRGALLQGLAPLIALLLIAFA